MGKIESLIGIINNEQHNEKATNLILDTLSLNIFAIHTMLVNKFSSHIDFEVLSENEIMHQLCPELEAEKDDKSKLAYYVNQFISQQEKVSEAETIKEKSTPQPEPEHISFESFRYKDYDTKFDNLTNLWDSLKKNNFIADDTDSRVFKKVFSGKAITKPVVWTGNPSEFAYFIKLMYHKLLAGAIREAVEKYKEQHEVSEQNLPVTTKYPEMVAEIYPHFEGGKLYDFGKKNLWFL